MTPSAISTLFGITPSPGSTRPGPLQPGTPFGDVLSREMSNRDNNAVPAPPARPTPQRENASTEPAPRPARSASSQPSPTPQLTNGGEAAAQAHQTAQRSQDKRLEQNNHAETEEATSNVQPATVSIGVDPMNSPAAHDSLIDTAKNKETEDRAKSETATADTGATDPSGVDSTNAAALLAAVNSLALKITPGGSLAVDSPASSIADQNASSASGTTTRLSAKASPVVSERAIASDPAFEALLAQAARLSEGPDGGSKQIIAGGQAKAGAGGVDVTVAGIGQRALAGAAAAAISVEQTPAAGSPTATEGEFAKQADFAVVPTLPGAATAGLMAVSTTGIQSANNLGPRVGTGAWDHALGQKVIWMAAGAEQTASLTLNPPDLGPLQVVINVTNSHAEASFTAAQPEVRQALEAAMPKLKEMLADVGISLGQTSVGAGSPNQHGADQHRANAPPGQTRNARGTHMADLTPHPQTLASRGVNGLVDTFV